MYIKHFYICSFCDTENKIKISESDRGTLQMKKGDEIAYTCSNCHKKDKIHINTIYAKPNTVIFIISIFIGIIATFFLLNIGYIASLALGFPIFIKLSQQTIANQFNNYKIKKD